MKVETLDKRFEYEIIKMIRKIILFGPYPKPYGGVSVHIMRLKERLERNDISCVVYDNSGKFKEENNVIGVGNTKIWILKQFLHNADDIIHFHGYSPKLLIYLSLLIAFKRTKVIITLHSFRYDIKSINLLDKLAFWLAKKYEIIFITVSSEIKDKIIFHGISSQRIEIIPAFIPPIIRDEESIEIPQETWNFIDRHTPVISANAFRISFYNGQDLYGIDLCIDLCANLKKDYPQIGFVFCLPDIGDYEYFNKMKQKIKNERLGGNFLFQTKPCQMYPIIMKSDVFVRPTNTDGYGVSVAEAICFKIPAVASDVCRRADGTILFKNRDINAFTLKVKDILDNYEQHKKKLNGVKLEDNFERILKIYQKLSF